MYRKEITKLPNKDDQVAEKANSIHPKQVPYLLLSPVFTRGRGREPTIPAAGPAAFLFMLFSHTNIEILTEDLIVLLHKHRNIKKAPDNRLPGDKVLIAINLPQHQKRNTFKKLKALQI